MKLLIDTHVLIWALAESRFLSAQARRLLEDGSNDILVGAGAAYEIEFKRPRNVELSRLPADIRDAAEKMGMTWLDIAPVHSVLAGRLPRLHGDPFDRLLVAQAMAEDASIVSRDPVVATYGIPTLW